MNDELLARKDTFRGVEVTIRVDGSVCSRCGFERATPLAVAKATQAIVEEYRRKTGLLTSKQIRSARTRLGMSQEDFANHLGVGVASVRRWETGHVQDRAMDNLIRLKTDCEAIRATLEFVRTRSKRAAG
jgi:putative zinc finger/helix-turn-helix YgiT family protein